MKKKLLCLFCLMTVLLNVNVVNVHAARPAFAFNVYAYSSTSQWTDNMYGNSNVKSIAGDPWTLIINSLSFEKPIVGVGMAYALFRNNSQISGTVWRTSTGTGYYSWSGTTGLYYDLKGRLDTDQPGYCISNGVYNADAIS
ncbi:MAG: hypothetical protein LUF78_01860 [Clostridiales bacterium]|nr:hypothetical protein [Clostridiales bacterium]